MAIIICVAFSAFLPFRSGKIPRSANINLVIFWHFYQGKPPPKLMYY